MTNQALLGLSEMEAAERLRTEGTNELPGASRRSVLHIVGDVVREPMFALLLVAGAIYLVLGDLGEAVVLAVFATLSVAIAVVQQTRSERVLEALRDLSSPRALVIRGGIRRRIAGREVVRGDLIVVAEGDRIPADATLLSGHDVLADESLLTGESVPVRKQPVEAGAAPRRPGGDDLPFLFSGSLIVRGHGLAEVFAIGPHSEIGKIGVALGRIDTEPPLLQRQTRPLVKSLAVAGLLVSVIVIVLYGLTRGSWLGGVLAGVAISMSLLPEEFPLVLTVFMVIGAWRISRARVLTRRTAAIEMLGAATVLCCDKTGTLTQNRMSVIELRSGDRTLILSGSSDIEVSDGLRELAEYGVLASAVDPFDPMEQAIHAIEQHPHLAARHAPDDSLIRSFAPRPGLLAMVQVWRRGGSEDLVAAAKGAPEAVAALCRLDEMAVRDVQTAADAMARRGMRILGVAGGRIRGTSPPGQPHDIEFRFLGLIGLADPLRPMVPEAVKECLSAGIHVVMVTGDYPATARAIAEEAGIRADNIITGPDIESMSDDELAARIRGVSVFARIMPEQKLRIVNAFKQAGDIVAMTGDGVNDAPSLKAAHIGVAMGGRGTDVAREAAALVLLDDDFGSIVRTVRLGRRIYDNLRKAMGYILAVHVPIAGLAVLPLPFGWPMVFTPIHIAFLEMVIDPVCSVAFEAEREEPDVMKRPPRDPKGVLFSAALAGWSLLQGALALLLVSAIYVSSLLLGSSESEVRALTFVSLVLTNIGLIFVNRSFEGSLMSAVRRPNPILWGLIGATAAVLAITLSWPPARLLFKFGPLHADDLLLCLGAGLAVFVASNLVKTVIRRWLPA